MDYKQPPDPFEGWSDTKVMDEYGAHYTRYHREEIGGWLKLAALHALDIEMQERGLNRNRAIIQQQVFTGDLPASVLEQH